MSSQLPDLDEISARLRQEDKAFQPRMFAATLLCIAVGVVVMTGSVLAVMNAKRLTAKSNRDLRASEEKLQASLQELRATEERKKAVVRQVDELNQLLAANRQQMAPDLRTKVDTQERRYRAELSALDAAEAKRWRDLGISAAKNGRYEEAIQAYGEALAIKGDDAQILTWRGFSKFRKGDLIRAAEDFRQATLVDDEHADAHYNLALTFWKLGIRDSAVGEFRRAVDLDPDLASRSRGDPNAREVRQLALR